MSDNENVPLAGSARDAAPGAQGSQPVDPDESIDATVVLRPRADGTIGAEAGDVDTVTDALAAAGVEIVATDEPSRRIRIRASAATFGRTFGASLDNVTSTAPDGATVTHRQRTGELTIPPQLSDSVIAVLGLDDRPQARSQARPGVNATGFTPLELGTAYNFPADTDGTGQSVGIVELGGGFAQSELDTYFTGLGLASPTVTAVGVDGATNVAGQDPQGADGEVLLDIEVIGALAPKSTISVYFAPNTDAGFVDAISEAIHATPTPAAVSISWGQSEDTWTAQGRTAMDAAFADAVKLGVVVTCAAGDNGSTDGATDGDDHVDFPASSPHVIGCGGTSVTAGTDGTITAEKVWNNGSGNGATGGGVSDVFALPAFQSSAGVPAASGSSGGRGVPDVSGNADPQTGYQVLVDGSATVIGGTSAVAPLWAALVARLAQATGGLLQGFATTLYSGVAAGASVDGLRDITDGNNGSYSAGPGWDACTGLGSPDGAALLTRLDPSST